MNHAYSGLQFFRLHSVHIMRLLSWFCLIASAIIHTTRGVKDDPYTAALTEIHFGGTTR